MLQKWQDSGHLYDRNAEMRADALQQQKQQQKQYQPVAESINRIVAEAMKKYLG